VFFAPIDHAVDGGNCVQGLDRHCGRSTPVDSAPQVAKLRAASGTRDFFNPAVRFQIVERQPELSSGLFVPEKRDFGVVLSPVDAQGLCRVKSRIKSARFSAQGFRGSSWRRGKGH
jgi:hypothetical protein